MKENEDQEARLIEAPVMAVFLLLIFSFLIALAFKFWGQKDDMTARAEEIRKRHSALDAADETTMIGVPLSLGVITQLGKVAAIGLIGGERYYWMIDRCGDVAMMPACTVE